MRSICRSTRANCLSGSVIVRLVFNVKKNIFTLYLPLDPAKVSMASTCANTNVSRFRPPEKPSGKMPNMIQLLFSSYQQPFLTKLVTESIASISRIFFDGRYTTDLTTLHHHVAKASHLELLAIFFLLLNVDQTLKKTVMKLEIESNYAKIERFLLDLRQILVVQFSINEEISLTKFVEQCEEYWILA